MSYKRQGPSVKVKLSCFDCVHETSERYQCQGDSGSTVYCTHGGGKRYVGDSTWETPKWCPLMPPDTRRATIAECVAALADVRKSIGDTPQGDWGKGFARACQDMKEALEKMT